MPGNVCPQVGKNAPITERQLEVLHAIAEYSAAHGYATTVRELSGALGNTSTFGTWNVLEALRDKGLVTWVPRLTRTLSLTDAGRKALEQIPAATTEDAR